MNILALDCAVSRFGLAVKAGDKEITAIYDIGMRQSELLVPAIDELLSKAGIKASELDCTTMTIGPGSFTGLRLGISALKAIELAYDVPVYGVSSLEAYSYEYKNFGLPVLSCIDANKGRFYASIKNGSKIILEDGDWETDRICESIKDFLKVILCGPDAKKLAEIIRQTNKDIEIAVPEVHSLYTDALIKITENKEARRLKDYDGPVYLRASEAEIKLNA